MSRSSAVLVERPRAVPQSAPTRAPRTARGAPRSILVRSDVSCLFGFILTAWTFASGFLPETDPGQPPPAYWIAGSAGALAVLASLLAHELGHLLAARRAGLHVARLTLSFAGGRLEIPGAIRFPHQELVIAMGGPIASALVMVIAAVSHVLIVETYGPGLPATVLALVAAANLALLLFNAIPGWPLDGGRGLRAVIWALTRRPDLATHVAQTIGRRVGEAMIVIAAVGSAFGFVGIAIWAAFLGLIVRDSAYA